ncbi:MAG: hypothetical protein ABW352_20210 [Polyangiales bacterium]
MRTYVWLVGLLLGFALGGCEDDVGAPTDVYVSFKTDLALGSEVSAVRVRVFRSGDNAATATPVSEHTVSADTLSKKLPLVIEKRDASEFLLAVQALGPGGDAQIERLIKVRFQDAQTVSLQVFLGRACLRKACSAVAGETCHGEARGATCEGSCAPVDGPDTLPAWSQARIDWQPQVCGASVPPDASLPPVRDAGGDAASGGGVEGGVEGGVDGGVDAAVCMPTVPGATCDAVGQCGCAPGKSCGVQAITGSTLLLGCVNTGTVANGSACSADTCVAGSTCVGSICRAFCGKDEQCGTNGHCVTAVTSGTDAAPIHGLSACFTGCSVDTDCDTGCCRPLSSAPNAGNLCLTGTACCAQAGASCAGNDDCCGFGDSEAFCVTEPAGGAICRASCSTGADCQSGCCAPLSGGGMACFAASQCQNSCAAANEPCQTNADCCGGAGDTQVCVNQGQGPICADRCTSNAQCQSGCCASLQMGGTVCAPPIYCQ